MSEITVTPTGPHEFGVQVTEGQQTSSHRVTVPESLLDEWGLGEDEEEEIVRESFAFLLEREPVTSIMEEFSLDVIPQFFPEYREELPSRLG